MASLKRFNGKYNLFCGEEINGKHVFWKDLMENRFSLEKFNGKHFVSEHFYQMSGAPRSNSLISLNQEDR